MQRDLNVGAFDIWNRTQGRIVFLTAHDAFLQRDLFFWIFINKMLFIIDFPLWWWPSELLEKEGECGKLASIKPLPKEKVSVETFVWNASYNLDCCNFRTIRGSFCKTEVLHNYHYNHHLELEISTILLQHESWHIKKQKTADKHTCTEALIVIGLGWEIQQNLRMS